MQIYSWVKAQFTRRVQCTQACTLVCISGCKAGVRNGGRILINASTWWCVGVFIYHGNDEAKLSPERAWILYFEVP